MAKLFANSGDPDQTPHSAASDLGLHCLPIIFFYGSPDYNGLNPLVTKVSFAEYIWAASEENVPSNMRKIQIQIILRIGKVSSGPLFSIYLFCSIHFFLLADMQVYLGPRCPHLPEDRFLHGAVNLKRARHPKRVFWSVHKPKISRDIRAVW